MFQLDLGSIITHAVLKTDRMRTGAQEAISSFSKASSELSRRAGTLAKDLEDTLGRTANGLMLLSAPIAAAGFAAGKSAVEFDSMKLGLTAVAGSAEEAERQLRRLREVAKLPGLGFEQAVEGARRLQAAGLTFKESEKAIIGFGTALARAGYGKEEMDGTVRALSQISSKGKIFAEEINQIAERIPDIRTAMIKAFGTADTEILQKARITAREFINAISDEIGKKKVTGGLRNDLDNLMDTIGDLRRKIGESLAPDIKRGIKSIEDSIKSLIEWWGNLSRGQQEFFKTFTIIVGLLGPAAFAISKLAAVIKVLAESFVLLKAAMSTPAGPILVGLAAGAALAANEIKNFNDKIKAETDRRNKEAFGDIDKKWNSPDSIRNRIKLLQEEIELNKKGIGINKLYPEIIKQHQQKIDDAKKAIAELQAQLAKDPATQNKNRIDAAARAKQFQLEEEQRKESERRAKAAERERLQRLQQQRDAIQSALTDIYRLTHTPQEFAMREASQDLEADRLLGVPESIRTGRYKQRILAAIKEIQDEIKERAKRFRALSDEATLLGMGKFEADEFKSRARLRDNLAEAKSQAEREIARQLRHAEQVRIHDERQAMHRDARLQITGGMGNFNTAMAQMSNLSKAFADQRDREVKEAQERDEQYWLRSVSDALDSMYEIDEARQKWADEVEEMERQEEERRYQRRIREMQRFTGQMEDIFTHAFEDIFENGFQNFFDNVLKGFQQMLARMIAEWLAKMAVTGLVKFFTGGGSGGFLGGLFSFLGFDSGANDALAKGWGFDWMKSFGQGVGVYATQRNTALAANMAGGGIMGQTVQLNLNFSDVHIYHETDERAFADRTARGIRDALASIR